MSYQGMQFKKLDLPLTRNNNLLGGKSAARGMYVVDGDCTAIASPAISAAGAALAPHASVAARPSCKRSERTPIHVWDVERS
jgi:hypothetical protein